MAHIDAHLKGPSSSSPSDSTMRNIMTLVLSMHRRMKERPRLRGRQDSNPCSSYMFPPKSSQPGRSFSLSGWPCETVARRSTYPRLRMAERPRWPLRRPGPRCPNMPGAGRSPPPSSRDRHAFRLRRRDVHVSRHYLITVLGNAYGISARRDVGERNHPCPSSSSCRCSRPQRHPTLPCRRCQGPPH